jgi:galactose mutarotase-like enzyme
MTDATFQLRAGDTVATVARRGAELISWQVRGRELIWKGDPAHWSGRAPILFPVVGASSDGQVRVDGRSYPMPQHGFARNLDFDLVEHRDSEVLLRLVDSAETRRHYPFAFELDVLVRLAPDGVDLRFTVRNTGERSLPYALGFHPAFPWPFDCEGQNGHAVRFEQEEAADVPSITAGGLLDRVTRPVPLDGVSLALSPALFKANALVFVNARSRRLDFVSPSGAAIALEAKTCPHLAVWTKPDAPFLSMEAWTGHADWSGFTGDLTERNSTRILGLGDEEETEMSLRWLESREK